MRGSVLTQVLSVVGLFVLAFWAVVIWAVIAFAALGAIAVLIGWVMNIFGRARRSAKENQVMHGRATAFVPPAVVVQAFPNARGRGA